MNVNDLIQQVKDLRKENEELKARLLEIESKPKRGRPAKKLQDEK